MKDYPAGFFSEPVRAWSSMRFVSQTTNPESPFYVGSAAPPKPLTDKQRAAKLPGRYGRSNVHMFGFRLQTGTRAWQIRELIKKRSPLTTNYICVCLGISPSHVAGITKQLVTAGVLRSERVKGTSMFEFSLGPAVVCEVAA